MSNQKVDYSKDENEERGNWRGRLDFLLSCIGFAVGLGNVWRFPYLCYRNGGGAFLIPYTIMLVSAGLPLFFMELALSQFSSEGPSTVWKISPLFKGVGYAMISITALVAFYYNLILAYAIFYFFASWVNFSPDVPWIDCNNEWNTPNCGSMASNITSNETMENMMPFLSNCSYLASNVTMNETMGNMTTDRISPAEEYWNNYVLERSSGIGEMGTLNWKLTLCLLTAWIIVFFCLIKGVKSTGKVVYFTATFPYIVLTILIVRGATLPGSLEGVTFYIVPDFGKLLTFQIWGDAAVQIFYSLGPAWGGLLTMSSYNRFHNNCYRDAVIVAVINCATSVYAGFAVFSVIGFMAYDLDLKVENVTTSGAGLAFVVYPEGLSRMPVSSLWSALFFFMLITLGLDSMFVMIETIVCGIVDDFPKHLRKHKTLLTFVVCVIGFFGALPMVTNGGVYWMALLDWYSAGFSLMTVSLFEVAVIMYSYGYKRFSLDIEAMIGHKPNMYWIVTWVGITPAVLVFIIIFSVVTHSSVTYDDVVFPDWAIAIGWLTVAVSLLWIPGLAIAVWATSDYSGTFTGKFRHLTSPTEDWGPALEVHRKIRESIDGGVGNGSIIPAPSSGKEGIDNPAMPGPVITYF